MQWQIRIAALLIGIIGLAIGANADSIDLTSTISSESFQTTERVISKVAPEKLSNFTVSPNGKRFAYIAWANGKPERITNEGKYGSVVVVLDGKKGEESYSYDPYDQAYVHALTFSPDSKRFAYLAADDGNSIVVDGVSGESYSEIYDKSLLFSPDSKRIAYIVRGDFAVIDNQKENQYGGVNGLIFSPDSKRVSYIATGKNLNTNFVVVNGSEGKHYDSIDSLSLVFSPDSEKLAYVAKKGAEYFIVMNGQEGTPYRGIGRYCKFSSGSQHFACVAMLMGNKWCVIADGKEGRAYDAQQFEVNPVFSPDGVHLAYLVQPDSGDQYVVLDGQEGKRYKHVGGFSFSPDGKHTAYYATNSDGSFVVVDGAEGTLTKFSDSRFIDSSSILFSSVGSQLAYVVNSKNGSFVVRNGEEGKHYSQVQNLVYSSDGKHLAYAARDIQSNKWVVVIDGREGNFYDFILAKNAKEKENEDGTEIKNGSLQFDSADALHYLAVKGKNILSVNESLAMSSLSTTGK